MNTSILEELGPDLASMTGLLSDVQGILRLAEIAEDEIEKAMKEHDELHARDESGKVAESGPLRGSFKLLEPTASLYGVAEFVFRQHCVELLERVARGEDTRPATGPELVGTLGEISVRVPLHGAVVGLYMKLFTECFPAEARKAFGDLPRTVDDYERIFGDEMADHEAELRCKIYQEWRTP